MMMNTSFRSEFYRNPLRGKVSERLISDIRKEVELHADRCVALDPVANAGELAREQGATMILKELIDVLCNGVSAPAPDAGISGAL